MTIGKIMEQNRSRYDQQLAIWDIFQEFPALALFRGGLNVDSALLRHFKGGLYRVCRDLDASIEIKDVRTTEQIALDGPSVVYQHMWPFERTFYRRSAREFWDDTLPSGWVVPTRRFTPIIPSDIFPNWPER